MQPLRNASAVALGLVLLAAGSAAAQNQQVGARTKAMGGSYTAFEDDPVSIWLNPAGIATQPNALSLAYQSYTTYEIELNASLFGGADPRVPAATTWSDPALIPSYLGVVVQVGSAESSGAFGFCFTSPFILKFPVSLVDDDDVPGSTFEQVFYRFRTAYAHDLRFVPPGEEGAFTHLALGLALDLGISRIHFTELSPQYFSDPLELDLSDTGVGGGVGLLLGVYDNTRNFKVNLGAAWQSKIHYRFSASPTFATQFDWPNQYQVGVTFYLLEEMPLRLTFDAQRIAWGGATADSSLPDGHDFEDVNNYSIGAEYRLKIPGLLESMTFYPRAGFRFEDAPWDSTDRPELPAIRERRMIIDPKDDLYRIWSIGLGVGWASEGGAGRMIDLAFERGGDANNFALGLSLEF